MILALIIGALIGAALQPLSVISAGFFLHSRGKSLDVSLRETVLMCVVLACFGASIGFCAQTLATAVFLFALLFVASVAVLTDHHQRIIPNELVLALFAVRLVFGIPALLGAAGFPAFDVVSAALGCGTCLIIFALPAVAGKQIGFGDVKFVAAMGFCLGLIPSLYAVALMGVLVLVYLLFGRQLPMAQMMKQMVPMAPFLCVAMMVVLLVQMSPAAMM